VLPREVDVSRAHQHYRAGTVIDLASLVEKLGDAAIARHVCCKLTPRQISERAMADDDGPSLWGPDTRSPEQRAADQLARRERAKTDAHYRRSCELWVECAYAHVVQERDDHGQLQTRGYDPETDEEPWSRHHPRQWRELARSHTATTQRRTIARSLPRRARARRRRSRTSATRRAGASSSDGDSAGPPSPHSLPSGNSPSAVDGASAPDAIADGIRLVVAPAVHAAVDEIANLRRKIEAQSAAAASPTLAGAKAVASCGTIDPPSSQGGKS